MSDAAIATAPAAPALGMFERWLTLWVGLCIATGVALGQFAPAPFRVLAQLEIAHVNVPVGLLVWLMIVPMLVKIDFGALHRVTTHARGIAVTLFINWAVKPFSMALLAWLFCLTCSRRGCRRLSRIATSPA
jgi:ACR3 family arsenite transporter